MPTSSIIVIVIGTIIALSVFVFSLYLNKKKSTTKISDLKFSIILFVALIVAMLIITLIFSSIMNDNTSFWSMFFGYLQSPMFIGCCITLISVPIFNRFYARYRQKKEKAQNKDKI